MRGFRLFLTAALVASLALVATQAFAKGQSESSGASGGTGPVNLLVWDQFTTSDAAQNIYDAFMAKYPNIKIKREAIQTDQMRQTVKTALSAGTGPDVVYYDAGPGYAGVLVQAGLLLSLDKYASQYDWGSRIAKAAIRATTINGKVYGVPLEVDLIGMYYNKTLIDGAGLTVPKTFNDLLSFCAGARAKGYIPISFGEGQGGWEGYHQFSMTAGNMVGPEYMTNLLFDHTGKWNSPQMVEAIKAFFVDLNKADAFPKGVNGFTYDDQQAIFTGGKALLFTTGSWVAPNVAKAAAKNNWDIQMAPFPSLPGGKGSYYVTGVGSAWYISKLSAHPDQAAQFINYLISPEAAKTWVEKNGSYLPIKMDTSTLGVPPLVKGILDVLQRSIAGQVELSQNIDVLTPPDFNLEMQNGFEALLAGQQSPQQVADALQSAWQSYLSSSSN